MTYTIGLVPSPGVAHKLVDNAIPKIQQHLHERKNMIGISLSVLQIYQVSQVIKL